MDKMTRGWRSLGAALILATLAGGGCSVKRYAVNSIGDALTSGVSAYETDDDIALVGDALPFSLKLLEILIAESPKHEGLLLSACKGFTLYSYAYVQQEAELSGNADLDARRKAIARARRLYLRGLGYGLRALDAAYPGIRKQLVADPAAAAARTRKTHVPVLYWNAAALGLAISVSKGEAEMIARVPEVQALLNRALELDEAWEEGTLHEFRLVLTGALPFVSGSAMQEVKAAYHRALELSGGKRASLYVSYAETVSVKSQNVEEFKGLLEKALAIDPDAHESLKLANRVAQRRAQWLLGQIGEFFLIDAEEEEK